MDGPTRRGGTGAVAETEALHRAASHCHAAFAYCATEASDVHDLEDLLCLADCARICSVTAEFILRGSVYVDTLRDVCDQMCKDAAAKCEGYRDDAVLLACAQALRDASDALSPPDGALAH